jgi:hypothetical protein
MSRSETCNTCRSCIIFVVLEQPGIGLHAGCELWLLWQLACHANHLYYTNMTEETTKKTYTSSFFDAAHCDRFDFEVDRHMTSLCSTFKAHGASVAYGTTVHPLFRFEGQAFVPSADQAHGGSSSSTC